MLGVAVTLSRRYKEIQEPGLAEAAAYVCRKECFIAIEQGDVIAGRQYRWLVWSARFAAIGGACIAALAGATLIVAAL